MPRGTAKKTGRKPGRPSNAELLARSQGALALATVTAAPKLVPVLVSPDVAELLAGMPAETLRKLIFSAARIGLAKL